MSSSLPPLVDSFGRVHNNLRVSVTDRCNIRCFYCMPNENVQFKPRDEILTFEEISRFVRLMAECGVNKVRLTGGEPLVRADLPGLVSNIAAIPGITDIAMTTNGILLSKFAKQLRAAGLNRLNVSLDALDNETFRKIARRDGLQQALDGIQSAIDVGFDKIRMNAVAIKGMTESQILPLARFARTHRLELRFIEFMPLDAEATWTDESVLDGKVIREMLSAEFGKLREAPREDASQPAVDYLYSDQLPHQQDIVGFIDPVSSPFCSTCNRLRITAEGTVRNCLFSDAEWDVRSLLRSDASDEQIIQTVRDSISQKKAGHGIDSDQFVKPARAMYQIGG